MMDRRLEQQIVDAAMLDYGIAAYACLAAVGVVALVAVWSWLG